MQRAVQECELVTADDRTGALEVAAELATMQAPVMVYPFGNIASGAGMKVIDLGTRGFNADVAAERLRPYVPTVRGHKIDSTLRGNWVTDVQELARQRRVLMVPAAPALGRTCVEGVVHVHGRPLANGNIRAHLPHARWLPGVDAVHAWLTAGEGIAVCAAWPRGTQRPELPDDVVVVGPAAALGDALRCRSSDDPSMGPALLPRREGGRALVVCGSASAVARRQIEAVRTGVQAVQIIDTPPPSATTSDAATVLDPAVIAERLAQFSAAGNDWRSFDVVVAVGGDTAAALFGDAPCEVGGYAALGVPWSVRDGVLTLTKAGAFGGEGLLVDLLREVLGQNG